MTLSESITTCMGKYATFSGRATRSEYWWFYLFALLLTWGADVVGAVAMQDDLGVMGSIVSLALLLPSVAVGARRLHDIGRSGWWQLLVLTVVGIFLLIYWFAKAGETDANAYGEANV
jgi:uncharacterized membrane protein YhaH (DUF805 family)